MPCLEYTPGSCDKGVANTLSGFTHAMASWKCSFYATVKLFQAIEKLSTEAVARELKVDVKKSNTGSSKKNVRWRTRNEGVHVNKEDLMDQSQTTRY